MWLINFIPKPTNLSKQYKIWARAGLDSLPGLGYTVCVSSSTAPFHPSITPMPNIRNLKTGRFEKKVENISLNPMHIPPFDFDKNYHGNLDWLKDRIVYMCEYGSHAYGTATESSDWDYRGVAIAPIRYYTGILNNFEQTVFDTVDKDTGRKLDVQVWDIRVFARHITQSNPSVLECLFMDESSIHSCHSLFRPFLENRNKFLSKRSVLAFSGYSVGQFHRIKSHRHWLLNPPKKKPERADFGLSEMPELPTAQLGAAKAAIKEKTDRWSLDFLSQVPELDHGLRLIMMSNFDRIFGEIFSEDSFEKEACAAKQLGMDSNFIDHLKRESAYEKAMKSWNSYNHWKETRNPERAAIEAKYGYDCKHAMHLVRLMTMCQEILNEGTVRVLRPDAEELLAVRNGKLSYEEIEKYVLNMDEQMKLAARSSNLPNEPDRELLEKLTINAIKKMNR